jgi:hypothetical protein
MEDTQGSDKSGGFGEYYLQAGNCASIKSALELQKLASSFE